MVKLFLATPARIYDLKRTKRSSEDLSIITTQRYTGNLLVHGKFAMCVKFSYATEGQALSIVHKKFNLVPVAVAGIEWTVIIFSVF